MTRLSKPQRRLGWLVAAATPLALAQAAIPIDQFVHRGDDAFYYFQVAENYARLGFWTFDGIHPTNGVQPLWAIVLSAAAVVLDWIGIQDPHVIARLFVALAALCHAASCLLLFQLLARTVSAGTGLVAAGAFLFPMGIVWSRVWGMENGLYALLLTASLCHLHLAVASRPTIRNAAGLGALLGLTALARLNAALFVPIALAYLYWRLRHRHDRHRLVAAGAVVAGCLMAPYFAMNLAGTGHLLPVSGVVKDIRTRQFLETRGVDSRLSPAFVEAVGEYRPAAKWFVTSRLVDTTWIAGGRLVLDGNSRLNWRFVLPLLAVLVLAPLLAGRPRRWVRVAWARARRLSAFSYVLAFAVLNTIVSVFKYPSEVGYGMIRWWFVEGELVLVCAMAALVAASGSYLARRFVRTPLGPAILAGAVAVLIVLHAQQMVRFYWSGTVVRHDWKLSWNDEIYAAALWLNEHAEPGERIGSWNAGLLGFYTNGRVINLDGLANSFELVPYLEQGRIAEYIKAKKITYLSDIETEFHARHLDDQLPLTEVYSRYSAFMGRHYRIYRVGPEAAGAPAPR